MQSALLRQQYLEARETIHQLIAQLEKSRGETAAMQRNCEAAWNQTTQRDKALSAIGDVAEGRHPHPEECPLAGTPGARQMVAVFTLLDRIDSLEAAKPSKRKK